MTDDLARMEEIFGEALALADSTTRAAYLDEACAGNPQLRERIEALLAAHDVAGDLLKLPSAAVAADDSARISEGPGSTIGRFKLLERIGEGGFGVVYMAEQQQPVRRKVALKIIKLGMDTKQVVARFEAERQALALMDHPNIAKVFDAGATDTGRPYFVMELIRGIPITEYCDTHTLSVPQRLELFGQVCQAAQHAHQKGIIHRDLKPTNVLVALLDDRAVPKIIDFGVAKAIEGKLTERTLFTGFHQLIGTPAYMSPEQAQLSGSDADTRSDIYSLGVLLYELLTGTTPFDSKQLLSVAFDEMQRIVREVEPPTPSKRLSTLAADTQLTNANARGSDPKRLRQLLSGDLDWIVMKCLEKDRSHRYSTANSLALDLRHYLNDEPVEARQPTRMYRLKKFVRRNKLGVLAGSAIALALALGFGGVSFEYFEVRRQAAIARDEATRSTQVAQFLKDMLAAVGPSVARGRDVTLLREILDKTVERVQKDLNNQPEVQGDLWFTLGATYGDIADYPKAITVLRNAADAYRSALGDSNAKLAITLAYIGHCESVVGNAAAARTDAQLGLDIARRSGDLKTLAECLFYAAKSQSFAHHPTREGLSLMREAVALQKRLGNDPAALGTCLIYLADQSAASDTAESESSAREALAIHRQLFGPIHTEVAYDVLTLGQILLIRGKVEEAEKFLREAVELHLKLYGKNHSMATITLHFLAEALIRQGKWNEAETLVRQGAESDASAGMRGMYWDLLGSINAFRGEWHVAAEQLAEAVKLQPKVDQLQFNLAVALMKTDRVENYRAVCHELLERNVKRQGVLNAEMTSKAALLLPMDGADFASACHIADVIETIMPGEHFAPKVHLIKALADYRQKHYESAKAHAEQCIAVAEPADKAMALFVQAAACARSQQAREAREALIRGDQLLHQPGREKDRYFLWGWADWAIAELLRREVAELVEPQSPANQP